MLKKISKITRSFYVALGILLVLFPMYITIVTAFKTPEASSKSFFSLPTSFYLGNIETVINKSNYLIYVGNSFMITVVSVAIIAVFVPMVSYSIARNMNGSKYYTFLYYFFIAGIFIPFQVIMLPLVKQLAKMHMMTKSGIMLLYVTYSLMQGIFLFVGYIKTIPLEIEESAFMDGCTVFKVYYKIIFPLIKPMTATVVILNCLWIWNDFMLPLIILSNDVNNWTLPLFQYNFKSKYTFDYNLAFASFLMAMIPIIALYAFLQKYLISGLTAGAVKS